MHAAPRLDFQLISPEKILFQAPVSMVVIPAARGAIGVLPKHAPMIMNLQSGVVDVYQGEDVAERIFVGGGFAEITPQACNIVAEDAIFVKDVNPDELESYIKTTMAEIEAVSDIDEKDLLKQNVEVALTKIELFKRLTHGSK